MFLSCSSWILRSDRIINKESLLRLLFLKPFSDPTFTYLFWTAVCSPVELLVRLADAVDLLARRSINWPIYWQGRDERHNRVDSLFFFCVSAWKYCDLRHVQKCNPHSFSSMFLMRGMSDGLLPLAQYKFYYFWPHSGLDTRKKCRLHQLGRLTRRRPVS